MRRSSWAVGMILVVVLVTCCVACSGDSGTSPTAPGPGGVQEISWERVIELVYEGRVVEASQTHALVVTIRLADGTVYQATEPQIDAIFMIVEEAPNREDIVLSTE